MFERYVSSPKVQLCLEEAVKTLEKENSTLHGAVLDISKGEFEASSQRDLYRGLSTTYINCVYGQRFQNEQINECAKQFKDLKQQYRQAHYRGEMERKKETRIEIK
mmetsp:Transcript_4492/g.7251  ORF Transcript_4492/g.7251 Transcript_4492/m.7251 type:complete len:106 (+) Transcript_4492:57-374(+)